MPVGRRMRMDRVTMALAAVSLATAAHAGQIALTWDAVPGATGYRVYYGTASQTYTASVTSTSNNAVVSNLQDCTSWFLAVKAYNAAGESPSFSNEVSGWPRPALTSITPTYAMQGDQVVVDIYGANFQPGAAVDFGDPNISVGSASVLACNHVQVLATVEPTASGVQAAKIGAANLSVVNPDTVFGLNSALFQVRINPARFDVNQSDATTKGRIDGKDTVWMARMFGLQNGNATYDPDFDFDGDGWVDGDDLAYIASNLGGCWTGTAWSVNACSAGLK